MAAEDKEKNVEELDLWELFKKIGQALKSCFVYLLRRSIWLAAFVAIGVIFCIYLSLKDKKYYSSMAMFCSKNVNSTLVISQIDALGDLFAKKKYDELVLMLQIPRDVIEEVKSIKGLYAIDADRNKYPDYADVNEQVRANPKDTTLGKMDDYFYLKLDVYSDKPFASILQALQYYINKDEFLKRENEYAIVQQKQLLATMKEQVALLDSFQKADYFKRGGISGGQQLYLIDEKGTRLYHSDYLLLYQKQQKLEKDLAFYTDVITPVQGLSLLTTPENSFVFYLKEHIWKFLLLGFICVLLWDYRRFLLSNMLGKKTAS